MNWYVIAGMMLVTWVPRFVPLLVASTSEVYGKSQKAAFSVT